MLYFLNFLAVFLLNTDFNKSVRMHWKSYLLEFRITLCCDWDFSYDKTYSV